MTSSLTHLLLLSTSILLTSCSGQQEHATYIFGHEVDTVTLCGSGKTYWVEAQPDVKTSLRSAHKSLTTMPYQAIYITFDGHIMDKTPDGFAERYAGYYFIEELHEVRPQRPQSCKIPE